MIDKTFLKAAAKTAFISLAAYGLYQRFAPSGVKRVVEGG